MHHHANRRETDRFPVALGTFLTREAAVLVVRADIAEAHAEIVEGTVESLLDDFGRLVVHTPAGDAHGYTAWSCSCESGERAASETRKARRIDDEAPLGAVNERETGWTGR